MSKSIVARKNSAVRAVTILVSTALLFMGLTFASAAQAGPGDSFDRGSAITFIAQSGSATNDSGTQLYLAQQQGGSVVEITKTGSVDPVSYNAIGFNQVDGYLYGIQVGGTGVAANELVRIGQEGVTTVLGPVAGLPDNVVGYNAGDMGRDAYGDILFVRMGTNAAAQTGRLWLVDVTTGTATTQLLSQAVPNTADLVYDQGYLWAFYGNDTGQADAVSVYRIEPASGKVDRFSLADKGIVVDSYGAQWLYGNGEIGILGNQTGNLYQIKITDPTGAMPTFSVINALKGPTTNGNDGASYLGEPVDLSLTKTGPAHFIPGTSITYTLVVTNQDPSYSSTGFRVTDELPAGLRNPTTTTPGASITDTGGTEVMSYTGAVLGPKESVSIMVTGETDPVSNDPIINTADVVGNESDPKYENNSDTITSTVTTSVVDSVPYAITYIKVNGGVETTITALAVGTITSGVGTVGARVDPLAAQIFANQPAGFGVGKEVDGPFMLSADPTHNNFVVKYINTAPTISVRRRVIYVQKGVVLTLKQILAIAGVTVSDDQESLSLADLKVAGYRDFNWDVVNYPGIGYVLTLEVEDIPGLVSPVQQIAVFVEGADALIRDKNPDSGFPTDKIPDGAQVGTDPNGNPIIWIRDKPGVPEVTAASIPGSGTTTRSFPGAMPKTGDVASVMAPLLLLSGALLCCLLALCRSALSEIPAVHPDMAK